MLLKNYPIHIIVEDLQVPCLILIKFCGTLERLLRKIIPSEPITRNEIELVVSQKFRVYARCWKVLNALSSFKCAWSCRHVSRPIKEQAPSSVLQYCSLFPEWLPHSFQSLLVLHCNQKGHCADLLWVSEGITAGSPCSLTLGSFIQHL